MLKLTDDGVAITLTGQTPSQTNGLFWFGTALLIGAIGVALAMSLLPERLALSALALLVVGSFIFNWLKQRQKKPPKQTAISSGVVWVRKGEFIHEQHGKQTHIILEPQHKIEQVNNTLLILTDHDDTNAKISEGCQYEIIGFETAKEAQIMQAVLQGKNFSKRHVNIKMQTTE